MLHSGPCSRSWVPWLSWGMAAKSHCSRMGRVCETVNWELRYCSLITTWFWAVELAWVRAGITKEDIKSLHFKSPSTSLSRCIEIKNWHCCCLCHNPTLPFCIIRLLMVSIFVWSVCHHRFLSHIFPIYIGCAPPSKALEPRYAKFQSTKSASSDGFGQNTGFLKTTQGFMDDHGATSGLYSNTSFFTGLVA